MAPVARSIRRILFPLSVALSLIASSSTPLQATVMVPMTIEDMAVQSAAVVRGRVLESRSAWDESHQRIYTFTEIEVLDPIHADQSMPKKVTVRTLGGEVGK